MPDSSETVNGEPNAAEQAPPSPYVGLSYYTVKDAPFFFGRESERRLVMSNLRAARLTLLHADSGVGKSSLLRAGVAARLEEIARSKLIHGDAIDVPVVFKEWKDNPVLGLIAEIEQTVSSYLPPDAAVELPRSSLTEAISAALKALDVAVAANRVPVGAVQGGSPGEDRGRPSTLLIILDQFEEYFLYGSDEVQERLADELSAAITQPDLSANFLISIREDSFAALGNLLRGRMSNVYGNDLYLDYLDSNAAREVIERPVDRYNRLYPDRWVNIEEGLVDALLADVRRDQDDHQRGGAGANGDLVSPAPDGASAADANGHDGQVITPYLQLVMAKLWEHDQGSGLLQCRTLEELHGPRQIVADHLNTALDRLAPPDREIAIESLRHLVTPSGTKIALDVGDVAALIRKPVEQVAPVLAALAGDARVLRTVPPAPGKSPDNPANHRFEIYHDVLAGPINDAANASELQQERDRVSRFRRIAAGALALAALAVAGAVVAVFALEDAATQKQTALSRSLAASAERQLATNPELATLLSLAAWHVHPTPLAENALRDALPQLQLQRTLQANPPVSSTAFSPDGSMIAVGNSDGIASVWDAGTHKRLATFGVPGLSALESVAFSPDGSKLVTAYGDGTARIWDVKSHRQLGQPLTQQVQGDLTSAVFSPNGKQIVTAGNSGVANIWDVRTHKLLHTLSLSDGSSLTDAAFSPNGKLIAASSDLDELEVWSATTYQPVTTQTNTGTPLYSVAFSPNSKELIAATGSDQAYIWNSRNLGQPLRELSGADFTTIDLLTNAMWSHNGKLIVASGLDGETRIWKASSRSVDPVRMLKAGNASMLSVAIDARGDRVVTAGADGLVRIWDPRNGKQLGAPLRTTGVDLVKGAAFNSDGGLVGNATYEGNVNMWNAVTGKLLFHYTLPHRAGANNIRIRDVRGRGTMAIVAGNDGEAYVIDARSGGLMRELAPNSATNITAADYSPATNEWVTAGQENSSWVIRLWRFSGSSWQSGSWTEIGNSKGITEPSSVGYIYDAEFSPDGKRIVVASDDGVARIWSSSGANLNALATFPNPYNSRAAGSAIESATFSQDGTRVLTASLDGTARVWDAVGAKHSNLATITDPEGDQLRWAAFSPDARWIATASLDGLVRVWDVASGRQLLELAGHSGSVNTVWFNSQGTRLVTASDDGTTKLWNALPVNEQGDSVDELPQADVATVAFSPNGRMIATANADGYTRLWDATTRQHQWLGQFAEPGGAAVSSAEFSDDGQWLVSADNKGKAFLWSVSSHQLLARLQDPDTSMAPLASAEISPDRTRVVTAGSDGARLWEVHTSTSATGVPIVRATPLKLLSPGSSLRWAVFSPDGRLVVTADNAGTAKIWDVSTSRPLATFTEPGGESVSDAWFSPPLSNTTPQWLRQLVEASSIRLPSGRLEHSLVVTSSDDGTARVWNIRTGAQLVEFREPGGSSIYNATFSPEGQFVLTNGQDGVARIWSLQTGAQMTQFSVADSIPDAEFSTLPGDRVVVGTEFGTARIFSAGLDHPMSQLVRTACGQLTRGLSAAEAREFGSPVTDPCARG